MKRAIVMLLALGLLGPVVATGSAASAAEPEPFEQVYPERSRMICHVARSGNAQRVLGFDTGFSFVHNGAAYWSVGDSFVDGDGDGHFFGPGDRFGFRTGSIGRTTDLNPNDCIDVQLRTSNGKNVLTVLAPDRANNECLIWPGRVFEANGRLFFFYTSVWHAPDCDAETPTVTYTQGLGELTSPSTGDLKPVRVGAGIGYGSPIKIAGRVYFFKGVVGNLLMARVPEERVTVPDRYEYWTGDAANPWDRDENLAVPIATGIEHSPTVAYNDYIGRYMMVYTCGFWNKFLCARTAKITGAAQPSLTGGWNEPTQIYECAYFWCGHGYWHSGYTDPAHPERIFVTSAHFPGREYFVTLKAIDLSDTPAPATSIYSEGERDFSHLSGTALWSYAGYDVRQPGAALAPLVPNGLSPPNPNGVRLPAHVGTELVDGYPAPGVGANAMFPSETRGAARVWTAPSAGTVTISGEAWLESTKGDGATADILLVKADGTFITLRSKPLVQKWTSARSKRVFNVENVTVEAGDKIVIGVRKGRSPAKNASNDLTFFPVSVMFEGG